MTQHYRVAPELSACIAEGRGATDDEISRLVDRLSAEIGGAAPAMAWGVAGADTSAALVMRVAQVALHGDPGRSPR